MRYWEIIADNLSQAGFGLGCVSAIDANGRTLPDRRTRRGHASRCFHSPRLLPFAVLLSATKSPSLSRNLSLANGRKVRAKSGLLNRLCNRARRIVSGLRSNRQQLATRFLRRENGWIGE